jgi:hypothetical protein
MKLQDLTELMKSVFVKVARDELLRGGEKVSFSRLSVMTGVHRKDVTRFAKSRDEFEPQSDTIGKVMVQWQHDRRFSTKNGKPRTLGTEGRESEFAELVESVNGGNLSAYAVLFEMERMGIVERSGSRAKLMWRDFAPDPTVHDGLDLLARDVDDLSRAVEENIYERGKVPNLHLKTVFDNVLEEKLPQIRAWMLEEGSKFHQRLRKFVSRVDKDLSPGISGKRAGMRIAFGTFSVTGRNEK